MEARFKLDNPILLEQAMSKELAKKKLQDERVRIERQKIAEQSQELKELQLQIKAAQVNKERSAQITEQQYRKQVEIEQQALIDKGVLRLKEIDELCQKEKEGQRRTLMINNRNEIIKQIEMLKQ